MDMRRTAQRTSIALLMMLAAFWLAGCGGDVTTGPAEAGSGPPAQGKTVLTLNTAGSLPAGATIGGLGITVNLPDSVTIPTDGSGNVSSGVVATSGVAAGQATVLALFSAATATVPAKLHLVLASMAAGMPVGEFATITCTVTTGDTPAETDFSLTDFAPVDTNGAAIASLAADLRKVAP